MSFNVLSSITKYHITPSLIKSGNSWITIELPKDIKDVEDKGVKN